MLEDKQDLLEAKFDSLVLELEEYKAAAKTLGAKNREIDDLKAKVRHLEAVLAVKSGVKVTNGDALVTSGGMTSGERSVEERLRDWDKDMRKVKSDLGELMIVYDDLQVQKFDQCVICCLYGEGSPRLDLEYPVYGVHERADEGAFTSVVVLTTGFPSGFR